MRGVNSPLIWPRILGSTKVKQITHTTTRQEQPHKQTITRTTPPPHTQSTTLKGRATTVRTTTHARVGGRAEVSVGGRIQVRRALGRARVRRARAGLLRTRQLEASRIGLCFFVSVNETRVNTTGVHGRCEQSF